MSDDRNDDPGSDLTDVLAAVGVRLRSLRTGKGQTLADVAEATGISVSTLSRLESGKRKATLELLVPLARVHQVPLDDLVRSRVERDPRVKDRPFERHGATIIPLTNEPGSHQAFKMILHGGQEEPHPHLNIHVGREWLYVLKGKLRLVLGRHDIVMSSGEAAEFDTSTLHWFGNADDEPVEVIVLFSGEGERFHVRARPPVTKGR